MGTPSQRKLSASEPTRVTLSPDFKRRRFLFALGAGGAGAAAAATQSIARPMAPTVASGDTDSPQGYRETEHVRDYYATTRI
jgi:hypothetical protein